MFDSLIFDIRCLQKNCFRYNPFDRMFQSIITHLPAYLTDAGNFYFFADHEREIPPSLAPWRDHIIYALPYRPGTVLVVKSFGDDLPFHQMPLVVQAGVCVLTLSDKGEIDQAFRLQGENDGPVLTASWCSRVGGGVVTMDVPAVADLGLFAPLSALEQLEADILFDDAVPLIFVDGALAVDIDIMRSLLGLTRRSPARILVWGDEVAVRAPEITVLRGGAALLGEVARRSVAVLVPASGKSQAISLPEGVQLGARCLVVDKILNARSLDELAKLPVGDGKVSTLPDYTAFWGKILAELPQPALPQVTSRRRIALVTPMFPQSGGPPHSSLDLALALTELADVEIWSDGDMLPAHRAKVSAVFRLDSHFQAERYDAIVYVLGNHPMYTRIFDLMREHGGALILHDAHMIDFILHRYGEKRFGEILLKEYGKPIDTSNLGVIIGHLARYERPFLGEIVRHANPVIVHSPTSVEILRDIYGVDTKYFPVAMPYPFNKADLSSEARLQAKLGLGISPSRPCIASFGEVHMMKGAKQCLFAMKELADWGVDFQFQFVGPIETCLRDELAERIQQYQLQDNVTIKGAVSESGYIEHLKASDLILQVRQIPFGQVSGALLDAVSAGMHGVASENLARSIEAPAFIRRVNDRASPTVYAEQLAQLIEHKSYEDRPGLGWEDFTVKHNFARYARDLMSLLFGTRH